MQLLLNPAQSTIIINIQQNSKRRRTSWYATSSVGLTHVRFCSLSIGMNKNNGNGLRSQGPLLEPLAELGKLLLEL